MNAIPTRKLPNFEVRTRNKTPIPVVLRRLNGGSVLIPKISCNFGCRRWCIISYYISARHFLRGLHSRLHPHHRFFFETPASTLDRSGVFVTARNFDKSFYGAFPFFVSFPTCFLSFWELLWFFFISFQVPQDQLRRPGGSWTLPPRQSFPVNCCSSGMAPTTGGFEGIISI